MWRGIKQLVIATSVFNKPTEMKEIGFQVLFQLAASPCGRSATLEPLALALHSTATAAVVTMTPLLL